MYEIEATAQIGHVGQGIVGHRRGHHGIERRVHVLCVAFQRGGDVGGQQQMALADFGFLAFECRIGNPEAERDHGQA